MPPIRLGCVKYLNTLPLIEGLAAWRDAELVTAVPSKLIGMLMSGEVDVALASVVDAAGREQHAPSDSRCSRVPSPVAPPSGGAGGCAERGVVALPVGMIGCDGPTLTVRLFSRVPIGEIGLVGVDTDSHTSAILMQVILSRRYGVRPRVVDFDARERMVVGGDAEKEQGIEGTRDRGVQAMLLIGDKVVTDAPSESEYPHQLDLGEAWREMTGLPFVYAVWMCRAGDEQRPEVLRAAAMMLDRQRRHNAMRLDWIVGSHATDRGWPEDLAAEYVGRRLTYAVGERERKAVAKFLQWAGELGLCGAGGVTWAW